MEHDAMCADQAMKLAQLDERSRYLDELLKEAVARGQQNVDEYHALSAKIDVLTSRHDALHRDFTSMRTQINGMLVIFAGAFILAAANFILNGGLAASTRLLREQVMALALSLWGAS